jgi:hypothetical protein
MGGHTERIPCGTGDANLAAHAIDTVPTSHAFIANRASTAALIVVGLDAGYCAIEADLADVASHKAARAAGAYLLKAVRLVEAADRSRGGQTLADHMVVFGVDQPRAVMPASAAVLIEVVGSGATGIDKALIGLAVAVVVDTVAGLRGRRLVLVAYQCPI